MWTFKVGSALRVPIGCQQRLCQCVSSKAGNNYHYDAIKNIKLQVPPKFNFAQDVIDRFAADAKTSDRPALFHVSHKGEETRWSYGELSDLSKRTASVLRDLEGLQRAIVVLPKVPEWWLLNEAAARAGKVLLPGTTLLSAADLASRMEASRAAAIVGDAATAEKTEEALQIRDIRNLKHKILVGDGSAQLASQGWVRFNDLMSGAEPHPHRETDCSEIIQIYFTSGTTGAPKMVPHTQASYGYCHLVTGKYWLDLTPEDLHWNISDTGWAKSAWSNVFAPWSQGACVFVHGMSRFVPSEVLQVLSHYPISTLCAPPTLYRSLVQENLKSYSFSKLRQCVSAGEPLNEEVINSWKAATGHLIREGYGQTETTLLSANFKG